MASNKNIGISGVAGSGKDTLASMILDELKELGNNDYSQYSFAAPLKAFARKMFFFTEAQVYDQVGKETPFTQTFIKSVMRERFIKSFEETVNLLPVHLRPSKTDIELELYWYTFLGVLNSEIQPRKLFSAIYGWVYPERATITFKSTPRVILQLLGTEFFRDNVRESFWTDIAPFNNVVISDMRFLNELDSVIERNGITIGVTRYNADTTASSAHSSENVGPVIEKCKWKVYNSGTLDDLRATAKSIVKTEFLSE